MCVYIYIYICVCVCVSEGESDVSGGGLRVCARVCVCVYFEGKEVRGEMVLWRLWYGASKEDVKAAEKACVQYTRALAACLDANSTPAAGIDDMMEAAGSGRRGEGADGRGGGTPMSNASASSAALRTGGGAKSGGGGGGGKGRTKNLKHEAKRACAGLAGSAAHCIGSRHPRCKSRAEAYARCVTRHGLQPDGGVRHCTSEQRALVRCLRGGGVSRESGMYTAFT